MRPLFCPRSQTRRRQSQPEIAQAFPGGEHFVLIRGQAEGGTDIRLFLRGQCVKVAEGVDEEL